MRQKDRIEVYGKTGKYYWRFVRANNKIQADGSEAYVRRGDLLRALPRLMARMAKAEVIVLDEYGHRQRRPPEA